MDLDAEFEKIYGGGGSVLKDSPDTPDLDAEFDKAYGGEAPKPEPTWEGGDGGPATLPEGEKNQWGGNLRNEGRKVLFRRDKNGKMNGYSTTTSTVAQDEDGSFVAIPTTIDGKDYSPEDAVRHYRETGEHWGRAKSAEDAAKIAQDVHDVHMKNNQKPWNDYIHEHWDEMSDEITQDRGIAYEHKKRTAPDKITLMEKLANRDIDNEVAKKEKEKHWEEDGALPSMSPFGMGVGRQKVARKYDDKAKMDDLAEIAADAGLADWQVKRIRSEAKTPDEMRRFFRNAK